ncbi:MAG: L,D-transpeptidase [Kofleriaceae bacterium]
MRSLVLLVAGCSSGAVEPGAVFVPPPPVPPPMVVAARAAPPPPPPARPTVYGPAVRSVRFPSETTLRVTPGADVSRETARAGVVRSGTRTAVLRAAPASHGCTTRWIEVAPRGWVCESAIVPSPDEPTPATPVALSDPDDGQRVVRGVYGVVRGANIQAYANEAEALAGTGRTLAGSHSVRAAGLVTVEGKRFWRTTQGDLIDESAISMFAPSKFKGVVLAPGDPLPGWTRARRDSRKPITTFTGEGERTGSIPGRTVVHVLEVNNEFVRIDSTRWISSKDVRVASRSTPPPGTRADEKWFDIELDQQVLVAYEGTRPVYATLVSTGKLKPKHYTPPVVARIFAKHETAHMNSEQADAEAYSVADVPWTMFYDGNYALHTSYWHDSFGGPMSHGCINLAPRDARLLYRWSSPDVPPGWTSVYADVDSPGSVVRVRSSRTPSPEVRGYARGLL